MFKLQDCDTILSIKDFATLVEKAKVMEKMKNEVEG